MYLTDVRAAGFPVLCSMCFWGWLRSALGPHETCELVPKPVLLLKEQHSVGSRQLVSASLGKALKRLVLAEVSLSPAGKVSHSPGLRILNTGAGDSYYLFPGTA